MTCAQGYKGRLTLDTALPFDGSSQQYEFIGADIGVITDLIDNADNAIRGTRSAAKERVQQGLISVKPVLKFNPSPAELNNLLPWILGTAESSDVFALAELLPTRIVLIDTGETTHTLNGCVVDKAVFTGEVGQPIELTIHCIGTTESTLDTDSSPAVAIDTEPFYVFHQGVMTTEGGSKNHKKFVLVIDNKVTPEYYQSQTVTDLCPQNREVLLGFHAGWGGQSALYSTNKASSAGATGTLVLTNSGYSTTFTFGNLKTWAKTPNIEGKHEIMLPIQYKAFQSGATKELVVTHDAAA